MIFNTWDNPTKLLPLVGSQKKPIHQVDGSYGGSKSLLVSSLNAGEKVKQGNLKIHYLACLGTAVPKYG